MNKDIGKEKVKDRSMIYNQGYREDRRLLFWNVAGIINKDKGFWEYIKDFDFISLCET